jgi:hypothetical protein
VLRSDDRAAVLVSTLSLFALVGACEIERVGIPRTESRVAVHAVLSATASSQVVLLERTRNGSVFVVGPGFDLADPIVSDEGIAESYAVVRLVTPYNDTLYAREDITLRGDGKGAGIYRFNIPGPGVFPNLTYKLLVGTADGIQMSAVTTVPGGVPARIAEARTFDRSRDTLVIEWPASTGARSYFVRIETPFGPRSFFTDATRIRLTGDLRNVDVDELPRVFYPGFPQAVTVSAVDSNYYDWFRSHNNSLTGTGLVNRVENGLGVFGSLVRLRYHDLDVVTARTEPIAGSYRFAGTGTERASTPYLGFELYVESLAANDRQPDALSGRVEVRPRFGYTGCLTCGMLGSVKDGRIELAMLNGWSARDTTEWFTGEVRGDTIVGSYRLSGGIVKFAKQR